MNKKFNLLFSLLGITTIMLISSGWSAAKDELDALTGGIHTRVAWREGGDQIKGGSNTVKGFDSKTGEVHTIWDGESCVKVVMASKGNRVLITSSKSQVYVVDWDGKNKKLVVESGMCSDAWVDPATGKEWCVYRPGGTKTGGGVTRCLIDEPSTTVRMWDGGEGHPVYPWFQMSADGKQGASFLPYSKAGVVNLETGKATMVSKGCWASHTSDNSYIWFHMQGNHKNISIFKTAEKRGSCNIMPPIKPAGQMYCERAAEGPEKGGRFFSVSGGYPGYNKNGNTVEVFVGKFAEDFNSVEGWARITNNSAPDHHSSAYVGVELPGTTTGTINPIFPKEAWTVLPDRQGGFKLYINQNGNFPVQIFSADGAVSHQFNYSGGAWHNFNVNQGPGIYLMQLGSDKNNVQRLFVTE